MDLFQRADLLMFRTKRKIQEFLTDETGELNIVVIVVLIGIAILLAIFFKEQIETLLKSLFGTITKSANNAVGGGEE